MAHWESHPLDKGLGRWRKDWDRLNNELYAAHPLFDSRFIDCLLHHFGGGQEIILVLRDAETIVGMTLLAPSRMGVWRSFLPSQLQVAPVLVPERGALASMFDALPWYCWQIELLCQDPNFSPLFREDTQGGGLNFIRTHNAVTMQVTLDGSFDDYWQGRSKNLRQNIKRYRSRMNREQVEPRISVLTKASDMAAALVRYGELESSGWKGAAGTAIHVDNDQGAFYRDVLEAYAGTDQIAVYEYYLGEDLSSSRLLLNGAGMSIILKTAYNEQLGQYSPGRMLLHALLDREFERAEYGAVEFYTNATEDQLRWSSNQREICHFGLFRNQPIERLYTVASGLRARWQSRKRPDDDA